VPRGRAVEGRYVVPAALALGGLYLGFLEPTGRDRAGFRRFKWAVGVAGIVAATMVAFRTQAPPSSGSPTARRPSPMPASRGGRSCSISRPTGACPATSSTRTRSPIAGSPRGSRRSRALKVDFTRADAPETIALRDRYAIEGVPTIVFLGADGQEVRAARIFGFVGPKPFLERLRVVREAAALAEAG
jgi:thiol:disulfide interchange protein DsbD